MENGRTEDAISFGEMLNVPVLAFLRLAASVGWDNLQLSIFDNILSARSVHGDSGGNGVTLRPSL